MPLSYWKSHQRALFLFLWYNDLWFSQLLRHNTTSCLIMSEKKKFCPHQPLKGVLSHFFFFFFFKASAVIDSQSFAPHPSGHRSPASAPHQMQQHLRIGSAAWCTIACFCRLDAKRRLIEVCGGFKCRGRTSSTSPDCCHVNKASFPLPSELPQPTSACSVCRQAQRLAASPEWRRDEARRDWTWLEAFLFLRRERERETR